MYGHDELGVILLPGQVLVAKFEHLLTKEFDGLVRQCVGCVVASSVDVCDCTFVHHFVSGMPFDLGEPDGLGPFGLGMLPVGLPEVPIPLQKPWSSWFAVAFDDRMDPSCLFKEGIAVSAYVCCSV